jgi:catechol 2,3-dioxygenase-like lactoylglutathione lyase family enzyme
MLRDHPIHPVLLVTDLAAARDFYHTRLGLQILSESEAAVTFRCGGGTQLSVTNSTTGTADTQTQASWHLTNDCQTGQRSHVLRGLRHSMSAGSRR